MRRAAMMAGDKTTESRMTPTERARTFDLRKLDAAFYADPYPLYGALRATLRRGRCPATTRAAPT